MVKLVNQAIKMVALDLQGTVHTYVYIYIHIYLHIYIMYLYPISLLYWWAFSTMFPRFPSSKSRSCVLPDVGARDQILPDPLQCEEISPFQGEGPAVSSILSSKYCTNLHFGCWPGAHKNFLQNWSQDGHPFCCFWNRQEFPIWETPGRLPNTFGVGGNWTPKNLPKKTFSAGIRKTREMTWHQKKNLDSSKPNSDLVKFPSEFQAWKKFDHFHVWAFSICSLLGPIYQVLLEIKSIHLQLKKFST